MLCSKTLAEQRLSALKGKLFKHWCLTAKEKGLYGNIEAPRSSTCSQKGKDMQMNANSWTTAYTGSVFSNQAPVMA